MNHQSRLIQVGFLEFKEFKDGIQLPHKTEMHFNNHSKMKFPYYLCIFHLVNIFESSTRMIGDGMPI